MSFTFTSLILATDPGLGSSSCHLGLVSMFANKEFVKTALLLGFHSPLLPGSGIYTIGRRVGGEIETSSEHSQLYLEREQ